MPLRCGLVLRVLCLAAAWPLARSEGEVKREEPSVLEIVNRLKLVRDAGISVFASTAKNMRAGNLPESADKVEKWSNDWLSILGVSKGITGLARDYVFNYLGRKTDYHDKNGKLIKSLRDLGDAFPHDSSTMDAAKMITIQSAVSRVCKEGKILFKAGGSLHTMLSELQEVIEDAGSLTHFREALKSSDTVREMFDYLSGMPPDRKEEL